jgi:redox-sensitive bicupin YhaK (pirin superfamily)
LKDDRINKLQTLVSPIYNDDPGLKIHQQAWIYRSWLDKNNTVTGNFHSKNHGLYVFVIEGKISVGEKVLNRRDAIGIYEADEFEIKAETDSDILILEVPMM